MSIIIKRLWASGYHADGTRTVAGVYSLRHVASRSIEAGYINGRLRIKLGCSPWRSPAWFTSKSAFDMITKRNSPSYAAALFPYLPGLIAVIESLFNGSGNEGFGGHSE